MVDFLEWKDSSEMFHCKVSINPLDIEISAIICIELYTPFEDVLADVSDDLVFRVGKVDYYTIGC